MSVVSCDRSMMNMVSTDSIFASPAPPAPADEELPTDEKPIKRVKITKITVQSYNSEKPASPRVQKLQKSREPETESEEKALVDRGDITVAISYLLTYTLVTSGMFWNLCSTLRYERVPEDYLSACAVQHAAFCVISYVAESSICQICIDRPANDPAVAPEATRIGKVIKKIYEYEKSFVNTLRKTGHVVFGLKFNPGLGIKVPSFYEESTLLLIGTIHGFGIAKKVDKLAKALFNRICNIIS